MLGFQGGESRKGHFCQGIFQSERPLAPQFMGADILVQAGLREYRRIKYVYLFWFTGKWNLPLHS